MKLVVDANIVFSALIAPEGKTAELFFVEGISLFTPEFLGSELLKHAAEIRKKSRISSEEFSTAISLLSSQMTFVPFSEFERHIPRAKEISPDPFDVEYIALALHLGCPLWTNDRRLKEQREVRVLSTSELLALSGF